MSSVAEEWKRGRVLWLNTVSDLNKRYAELIGVTDTPTFVLFNPSGQEIRRWVREAPSVEDLP